MMTFEINCFTRFEGLRMNNPKQQLWLNSSQQTIRR
jgi:hypothetical protein